MGAFASHRVLSIVKFHRQLNSSFFTLIVSLFLANIWMCVQKLLFLNAWMVKNYFNGAKQPHWFSTLREMVGWHSGIQLSLCLFCLTVNRMVSLVFPLQYKKWTFRVSLAVIAFCWLGPLLFPLGMAIGPGGYGHQPGRNGSLTSYQNWDNPTVTAPL